MTAREVRRVLTLAGCRKDRQKGSHERWVCGRCKTTIAGRQNDLLPMGTLKAIARQVVPCIGHQAWMPIPKEEGR
jgi:predicted RNA binding protein YcfA (HicA-like mRNA interferase family)